MDPQLTIMHLALVRAGGKPAAIVVSGEVDIYTAPVLDESLRLAVDTAIRNATIRNTAIDDATIDDAAMGNGDGNPGPVVNVDLAAVSFIDVRGLMVLNDVGAYARDRGVRLCFTGVPARMTRLLEITRLSLHEGGVSILG
jgi:anti-anti-sigma regulatory factor